MGTVQRVPDRSKEAANLSIQSVFQLLSQLLRQNGVLRGVWRLRLSLVLCLFDGIQCLLRCCGIPSAWLCIIKPSLLVVVLQYNLP